MEEALADLVDNSLDAGASRVLVRFFRNEKSVTQVAIVDDGRGMDEVTLHRAMQYGVQVQHKESDLGKYGIGLKTASFSQCQSLSVFSKWAGVAHGRRWTLTKMQDDWRCEILDSSGSAQLFSLEWGDIDLDDHGTIILWNDLDALGAGANDIEKLVRKIGKRLPVELGLRFHRFIASGRVDLRCDFYNFAAQDVVPLHIPALDPFGYGNSGRAGYPVTFEVVLPGRGNLNLVAHLWPANSEKYEYKLGGGRVAERQGFYFYRNDRLIQGGGWNGVRESDSEPHSSLARVRIDLPTALDSAFGLTIQKSKVVPPPDFRSVVLAGRSGNTSFEDYIAAAVDAYREGDDGENDEILVPGAGLPTNLKKRVASILGAVDGDSREITFEWIEMDPSVFFDVNSGNSRIYLNVHYRSLLVEKGAHSATDVPVLKLLLFMLLSRDLRKLRTSKKADAWHATCNALLIAAIKTLQ